MTSNFRLKGVYGLPTALGLVLLGFLAVAMWFSISHDSGTERFLFVLMLIVFMIHLLEASYPFRMIEISALVQDPPFCLEETRLNFEIKNTSNVRSEPCLVRIRQDKQWTRIEPIEPHSSRIVTLLFTFQNQGILPIPSIQLKTYTASGLHRFWRNIDLVKSMAVLPRPIDHDVHVNVAEVNSPNEELNNLEEIHDPSRFKFTDPKLFQKTNRRYQRVFRGSQVSKKIAYNWDELKILSREQKGEQFSFWLKSIARMEGKQNIGINVQAPFIKLNSQAASLNLRFVKLSFAKWFYEQV